MRFLGINHMDQTAAATAWVDEFDVPYPSLVDPSGQFAAALDYFGLPDTYVVDPSGTIRYDHRAGRGEPRDAAVGRRSTQVLADGQTSASSATATNSPAK